MAEETKQTQRRSISSRDTELLQHILQTDTVPKRLTRAFTATVVIFILVVGFGSYFVVNTMQEMHSTYIRNTEDIIRVRSNIETTNAWERLPEQQRKELLREMYFQIVRYYTNNVPEEQRMSDGQILQSFNQLWVTTQKIGSINFFLPVAYMKASTNFNPIYSSQNRQGIAGFYLRTIETTTNLPLVRNDPVFQTIYRSIDTANNPSEMVKILVARIDDLMTTFQNREDWVILALFTDEYNVISNYWENGEGTIPDEYYENGQLAETLKYYYAFKNWQIPSIEISS